MPKTQTRPKATAKRRPAPQERIKQLNVHLPEELVETKRGDGLVEVLERKLGRNRRDTIALAIQALTDVVNSHEAYAKKFKKDEGELYMRLALEAPTGFVQVPKDGVKVGRAADVPAVLVDDWLVFPDHKTGNLLAEEQGGERRIARIIEGEITPLKMPTPDEVVLN
jgi:hypothetical protein